MSELDGVIAILVLVVAALIWVAIEIRRVYETVAPLANSRLVRALSEV